MSYTKITSFTPKDTLLSGNPNKLVRGSELDAEFDAIAAAYSNVDNTSDATKNAATATLTNKTVNLTNNTLTGTIAQFNTACSDADFATGGGTATGTNTGDQTNITGNAATATNVAVGGITGLGTGVATALALNVGSAGAPVVLNGAGGTPSSINLANATAYPGTSALVTTGALNSGSITSGFGAIDVGADAISGGAINATGDISTTSTGRVHVRGAGTSVSYDFQIDNSDTFVNLRASRSDAIVKGYKWYLDNSLTLGMTLTSTGLNSTVIGATTPAAGSFTTLSATSLSVGADIIWTQSTDTYTRSSGIAASTQVVTDIHTSMRRCTLFDDGTVNYYLDAANSALKADGTASNLTGADGQVMVEIPATYVKFTPGASRKWAISLFPAPGYTLHPAFMKDGVFVPYRYRGAYSACFYDVSGAAYLDGFNWDINPTVDATATTGDKLASVSGKYPLVGVTRATCRVIAANRGVGWRVNDYWLDELIKLLFIVEYGTFNTQAKLGDGNSAASYAAASSGTQTDSPHSVAGKSNSLGNASTNTTTGASSATRDTAFMSYRGIENWYGNCWQFVDGVNFNAGQTYVSNTRSNFADDTATGYDILGAPNVATSGWQTNVQQLPFSFLPSAVGGSSSTYLGDYYYYAAGWRVAILGGDADAGASDGAFSLDANSDSANRDRGIGARLAF